ncbi:MULTISPECIES: ead/Ea22-like family protein [Enterobacteriaceae]|uniref:ead/Ea22-like family protein n=1 Tax=Enterobacteriaceae TaxID=543 RepID=UPI0007D89C8A|nr:MULTISPECIES: ead/Ea22-like family protein [Enterobacteriaceae]MBS2294346.1 ead/Ea22-like family protein [Salmonella enterica subsp. enterica serovar 1,4,[5],12:i:-]MDM1591761.1 ead/Ea22-like family protein [Escherichia coli]
MSETNYQELREAAQQASQGEWVAYILPGENGTTYPVHTSEGRHCGFFMVWPGNDGLRNAGANARYIAAIPPKVALSLLDEIKRQEDSNIDAMCRIAELETNIAALVAENAGLKHAMAVTLEHVSVTDAGQAGVAAMIINDALHHSETPATDAFLAEVRAQGVDAAIEAAKNLVAQEYEYKDFKAAQSDCCMHPGSALVGKVEMTEWLVDFADQLRKGGSQ